MFESMTEQEKLILFRTIVETVRCSLDIEETKQKIVETIGKTLNSDRCFIVEYDSLTYKFLNIANEYLAEENIIPYSGMNAEEDFPLIAEAIRQGKTVKVNKEDIHLNAEIVYSDSDMDKIGLDKYRISSGYAFPLKHDGQLLGALVIHYVNKEHYVTDEEISFLDDISSQISIALHQAKLHEKIKIHAEKEHLLRKIFETMRTSLDSKIIKNTIVQEIGKALDVDICFILNYQKDKDFFFVDENSEYKSSPDIPGFAELDMEKMGLDTEFFIDFIKAGKDFIVHDLDKFIDENLQNTPEGDLLKKHNIKSTYNIPIFYANSLTGCFALEYVKDYKILSPEDLDFLKIIATQVGVAIHQAELYELTKKQAETEKFNRKILEILRNTLDTDTIKSLFVKNIGKYFKANRVFFVDYDSENRIYEPINSSAEYLSSDEEKSFVDYNWSVDSVKEYINQLLEKREVKIFCLEDYINDNSPNCGFISRFQNFDVKSSYSFPIIHENKLMGFFCIEFTKNSCVKLSEGDINRIRCMCAQAGIALYHAELYLETKQCYISKSALKEKIKVPVKDILDTSMLLSNNEYERTIQIKYLHNIIESCNRLLELTNNNLLNN